MKVTVSDAENSQKELKVEIPAENYEKLFEQELAKVSKNVELPGFRKGKAPREAVLKKHEHQIRVTALEKLVNDAVNESIAQNDIKAISSPQVKDVKFEEEGAPITFTILVDVFPDVKIDNYKGFEFNKEVNKILKKDIDSVIDSIREKQAAFEPIEGRAIQDGDLVTLDFEGKLNGEIIESACAKDYELGIGTNTFIPGFESSLVGYELNQTGDIEVTFPESYHEKSLAGQPVTFTVTINAIKEKKLPEIDDELAQSLDEKYETLKDLTDEIKNDLSDEAENAAQQLCFEEILNKLLDENPFEIPASLSRDQASKMVDQQLQQYRMYGMDPAQLGIDKEKLVEANLPQAEKQVKYAIMINKIAEDNSIETTEEDVDAAIKEQAEKYGLEFEAHKKELEQYGGMMNFRNKVFTDKVFDYLESVNTVNTKVLTAKEMEEKRKALEEKAEAAKQ